MVHFHIFSRKLVLLFYLLSFKHRTLLSFHNERFLSDIQAKGKLIYKILSRLLNRLDKIIVVNEKCKSRAESFIKSSSKLTIINNFIPFVDVPAIESKIL